MSSKTFDPEPWMGDDVQVDSYDDIDDFDAHRTEPELCHVCGEASCYHCPECGLELWDGHAETCPYYESHGLQLVDTH